MFVQRWIVSFILPGNTCIVRCSQEVPPAWWAADDDTCLRVECLGLVPMPRECPRGPFLLMSDCLGRLSPTASVLPTSAASLFFSISHPHPSHLTMSTNSPPQPPPRSLSAGDHPHQQSLHNGNVQALHSHSHSHFPSRPSPLGPASITSAPTPTARRPSNSSSTDMSAVGSALGNVSRRGKTLGRAQQLRANADGVVKRRSGGVLGRG